jgi:O-antigen/teichoic acid export membrane protein
MTAPLQPPGPSSGAVTAARNAVKLGSSLLATWGVALVIRILMPRYLGPEAFGTYTLADTLAATYFVFLSLGVETYVQKEISVRPGHASDFFGGVLLARAALSLPLFVALALSLERAGAPPGSHLLIIVFGLAQLVVSLNSLLAALLQANGTVGRLALVNVGSKLLWGAGVGVGIALKAPLAWLAASFLVSETLRALLLWPVVRRELSLELRLNLGTTRQMLRTCVPFFINAVAIALCSKLDVTMLGFLTQDEAELGWYGAASNVAGLAMLLSPLVIWVVMPLLSRARAQSHGQFLAVVRGAVTGILTATLPIMLIISLGAEVFIHLAFGAQFAPAALSLRVLVLLFAFTYLAMLMSMSLVTLDRAWTLTTISLVGMVLNPVLASIFVPLTSRALGPGGAGVGAAIGVVGMEMTVTALLMWAVGRELFDRATVLNIGRSLATCAAVVLLHLLLRPLGAWRLLVDAVAYVALGTLLGAIRPRELVAFARSALGARRAAKGAAAAAQGS